MIVGLGLAARKSMLDDLVGFHVPNGELFDEQFFPGMWEDNDICFRAVLKGYQNLVLPGVFVHHEGSKTFKSMGDEVTKDAFSVNKLKFEIKWRLHFHNEDSKITAMLRVKDGIKHIERCLFG